MNAKELNSYNRGYERGFEAGRADERLQIKERLQRVRMDPPIHLKSDVRWEVWTAAMDIALKRVDPPNDHLHA